MEKASKISARQIIFIMVIVRVSFATTYFISLDAGNSIQDILLAVPALFISNFLVAIPCLILLRMHPGKSLTECCIQDLGKWGGSVIAILYALYFLWRGVQGLGGFQRFFINDIISDARPYQIIIPILIVCVYGAVKGIETIARFSTIVFAIYILVILMIVLTETGIIRLDYLVPLMANGPQYAVKAFVYGFNDNIEILFLAEAAQYLRKEVGVGRTYAWYNVISMVLLFAIEAMMVLVMGPFAGKQLFPLKTLSQFSVIGIFGRLDYFYMNAWILDSVLSVTFYLKLIVDVMTKLGLNGYIKIVAVISSLALGFGSPYISAKFIEMQRSANSPMSTFITLLFVFLLPLFILLVGWVKKKTSDWKDVNSDEAS